MVSIYKMWYNIVWCNEWFYTLQPKGSICEVKPTAAPIAQTALWAGVSGYDPTQTGFLAVYS